MVSAATFASLAQIKNEYKNALVLFRRGAFYEAYGEDAHTVQRVCGTRVLSDSVNGAEGISATGFPFMYLDDLLPRLVRSGARVAIADYID